MLAWHHQLAPLLGGRSRNVPKHTGAKLKLAWWLWAVRQSCLASFSPNNFPFLLVAKGRYSFMWNSVVFAPRESSYCPKNGLRSNFIAPKFQNFPGGACPQTSLGYSILYTTTTNLTTPNLIATALHRLSSSAFHQTLDMLRASNNAIYIIPCFYAYSSYFCLQRHCSLQLVI